MLPSVTELPIMNVSCPHCGKPAMTSLQKVLLGPGHKRACRNCDHFVSVPWWTILFLLPLAVSLLRLNEAIGITGLPWVLFLCASALLLILSPIFVPLVRRD
jgi:hypothetical protein